MRLVESVRRLDEVASRDHATGVFGTSHNACALAHFDSAATLGAEGSPIGPILSGGGLLCYDPFVIYKNRVRFNVTNPNMAVTGDLGQGKALDVDTLVPTPGGWTKMGEIRVGDSVFAETGQPCRVTNAWPVTLNRPCYEVVFDDGSVIVADADHQWVTETAKDRFHAWMEPRLKRQPRLPASVLEELRVMTDATSETTLPGLVATVGGSDYKHVFEHVAKTVPHRKGHQSHEVRPNVSIRRSVRVFPTGELAKALIAYGTGTKNDQRRLKNATISTLGIRDTLMKDAQRNHAIPCAGPLVGRPQKLSIPPYALGFWLGDGNSCDDRITSADSDEVRLRLERDGIVLDKTAGEYRYTMRYENEVGRGVTLCRGCNTAFEQRHRNHYYCQPSCRPKRAYVRVLEYHRCRTCRTVFAWHGGGTGTYCSRACYTPGGVTAIAVAPDVVQRVRQEKCRTMRSDLQALGVLASKHIPTAYLRAPETQRRDLLAGLLDTDGYCDNEGTVSFSVTNKRLARDTYGLIASLGYKAAWRTKRVRGRTEASSTAYIITFSPSDNPFGLGRKGMRLPHKPRRATTRRRYITSVRPVESRPVRCIAVDSPSHQFLVGDACIATHNSTTVQVYLRRQYPFGRFIRVIDPSPMGEYHALCEDLNGQKIRVAKDGNVTLNPLESPATRHALLRSMAAATTSRALKEREPALLNTALDAAGDRPILPDVLDRLFYPTAEMAQRVGATERQFAREARDLAMSLLTLCEGDLQGLFDGHTTADVDFSNQFILLDLSDLHDSQSLGILMACATSFLQAQIDAHYHQGEIVGKLPKSILVIDEAWKILALPGIGEWLIERIKFARKKAEQTVAIFHGLRDLDAAGDEGNRITKLAQGLVKDCGTFVIHKASLADANALQDLLNLSDVERDIIVHHLDRGCALWRVGPHRLVAFTHATADDLRVTSPDRAMTG